MRRLSLAAACAALVLSGAACKPGAARPDSAGAGESKVFETVRRLSPGVNYGNVFEANPPEGWGQKLDLADFQRMADAGLRSVRIPVRWNAKASMRPPYAIDPAFQARIDSAIRAALKAKLYVVLNIHHYDELFKDPMGHQARFIGLWKQIATHYKDYPEALVFELLNEPHDQLTNELWDPMYKLALAEVRKSNPTRAVIISGAGWGGAEALDKLTMPESMDNLIFTFHFYSPFKFTHQGAEWVGDKSKAWLGTRWRGTIQERKEIEQEMDKAVAFGRRNRVPLYLGEFGAYSKADMNSRAKWTAFVAEAAAKRRIAAVYWEFKAGFAVYDKETKTWNQALLDGLLKGKF